MLFHKFLKVPPIFCQMPLDFSKWGQKLPPQKYVNFLPCHTHTHTHTHTLTHSHTHTLKHTHTHTHTHTLISQKHSFTPILRSFLLQLRKARYTLHTHTHTHTHRNIPYAIYYGHTIMTNTQ